MDTIAHTMRTLDLSSKPSSLSTKSTVPATSSSDSSRKPSSATSISPAVSELDLPSSRKASVRAIAVPAVNPNRGSEASILDDITQGHTRALRRQALARKISAHLRTLPVPSLHSSSGSSSSSAASSAPATPPLQAVDDERTAYIDALAIREPEVYTPALAAYFADHVDAIPARAEDEATQRRKRYDAHETVTDRYGRTTRVAARQQRLFKDWAWEDGAAAGAVARVGSAARGGAAAAAAAAAWDVGPRGERERGDDVRCAHCERKERKDEMRRVAIKGLGRLIGRRGMAKAKGPGGSEPAAVRVSVEEKFVGKRAVVEGEAEHAEQVERIDAPRPYGTIRVR